MVHNDIQNGRLMPLKVTGLSLIGNNHIIHSKDKPLSRNAQEFLKYARANRPAQSPKLLSLADR
jgi:hypothetical protein